MRKIDKIRASFISQRYEDKYTPGKFQSVSDFIRICKEDAIPIDTSSPVVYDDDPDAIDPIGDYHTDKFDIVNMAREQHYSKQQQNELMKQLNNGSTGDPAAPSEPAAPAADPANAPAQ